MSVERGTAVAFRIHVTRGLAVIDFGSSRRVFDFVFVLIITLNVEWSGVRELQRWRSMTRGRAASHPGYDTTHEAARRVPRRPLSSTTFGTLDGRAQLLGRGVAGELGHEAFERATSVHRVLLAEIRFDRLPE